MRETIYLLTGAAGFLGINVAQSLIIQGKKGSSPCFGRRPGGKKNPAGS
jgi:thioester reductase-like protein